MQEIGSDIYFKLFANCIPVAGEQKALIYDLQRLAFFEIEIGLFEILKSIDEVPVSVIKDVNSKVFDTINQLVDNELGFFTESPELFPELSLKCEKPQSVYNAVVEINNDIKYDVFELFKELGSLKCRDLLLVINENSISLEYLSVLFESLQMNEIFSVEICFLRKPSDFLVKKIVKKFPILKAIKILNSQPGNQRHKKTEIISYEYKTHSDFCNNEACSIIPDFELYCESQYYNNCLNRKVAVTAKGEIKNCLYLNKTYGNYEKTKIKEVIDKEEFKELQLLSKDKIDYCKTCEYRYSCIDCRAFTENGDLYSKPLNCIKNNEKN